MRYGLIGEKLSHSFSPLIHKILWDCDYSLCPMSREAFVKFLKEREFSGINVTIPYKITALENCDEVDEKAKRIGSVNTIVNIDGRLYGYNTDYDGFLFCADRAGISFKNKKVLILGSGGTSLTARTVVRDMGARETVIVSRNGENNYGNIERHYADTEVIINTTPVGMYPDTGKRLVDLSL
ncbi:MAG: shikimate kinase, partial [Clostridiales bacterium]|nr:shikimate kinase [Clostridiales bacterium]